MMIQPILYRYYHENNASNLIHNWLFADDFNKYKMDKQWNRQINVKQILYGMSLWNISRIKSVVSWSKIKFFVTVTFRRTTGTFSKENIFFTRNSINACVCARYIFNEARDTHVPQCPWNWKKSGKGKNSQNTKEPSTMLFGLKNIDIRMARLCNLFFPFFFFFSCIALLVAISNLQQSTVKQEIRRIKKNTKWD